MKKEKDKKEEEVTNSSEEGKDEINDNTNNQEISDGEDNSSDNSSDKNAEIASRLEKELTEEKDRFIRMYADFENYKKRTSAEKESIYVNAVAQTVAEILPIADNLERALSSSDDDSPLKKGVEMVLSQLNSALMKLGVESYGEKGDVFNPNLHEAVMHGEDSEFEENTISEVFNKGYRLKDKIIRHAVVKVVN